MNKTLENIQRDLHNSILLLYNHSHILLQHIHSHTHQLQNKLLIVVLYILDMRVNIGDLNYIVDHHKHPNNLNKHYHIKDLNCIVELNKQLDSLHIQYCLKD